MLSPETQFLCLCLFVRFSYNYSFSSLILCCRCNLSCWHTCLMCSWMSRETQVRRTTILEYVSSFFMGSCSGVCSDITFSVCSSCDEEREFGHDELHDISEYMNYTHIGGFFSICCNKFCWLDWSRLIHRRNTTENHRTN